MHKIILDTDIGTDVDDLMALSFILGSPDLELLGITCAYGDTRVRAKIVHRVLALADRLDVPVYAGTPETLNGERDIFWPGHEGKNAGAEAVSDDVIVPGLAEDFLIETVRRFPGEVTVCAIAPLGNLARAVLKAPEIMRQVKRVVIMGGVFGTDEPGLELSNRSEHNIKCDPEAARVVFDFDWNILLVPLDVTTRVELDRAGVETIGAAATPLATLLHAELGTWLEFISQHHGRDFTHMHDPLTVACVAHPELALHSVQARIDVECGGEFTTGVTVPRPRIEGNTEVVLKVDVERFQTLFMERVTRSEREEPVLNRRA